jgi:hypothetical protein
MMYDGTPRVFKAPQRKELAMHTFARVLVAAAAP